MNNNGPQVNLNIPRQYEPTIVEDPNNNHFTHIDSTETIPFDDRVVRQHILNTNPAGNLSEEDIGRNLKNFNDLQIRNLNLSMMDSNRISAIGDILDRNTAIIISTLSKNISAQNLTHIFNKRPDAPRIDPDFIQDLKEFMSELAESMEKALGENDTIYTMGAFQGTEGKPYKPYSYEDISRNVVAHMFNNDYFHYDHLLDEQKEIEITPINGLTEQECAFAHDFIKNRGYKKDIFDRESIIRVATLHTDDETSKIMVEQYNKRPNLTEKDEITKESIIAIRNLGRSIFKALSTESQSADPQRDTIKALSCLMKDGKLESFISTDVALNSSSADRETPSSRFDDLIMNNIREHIIDTKIPGFNKEQNDLVEKILSRPTHRPLVQDVNQMNGPIPGHNLH